MPQLFHRDEPLIHEPEHELSIAPPADGIPVSDLIEPVERALFTEAAEDRLRYLEHAQAGQLAEAVYELAELIQRRDGRKVILLAERVVFLTGSRRVVNEARAVALAHLVPQDDPVLHALLGGKLVKWPVIPQTFQLPALEFPDNLVFGLQRLQPALDEVERFITAVRRRPFNLDLYVRQVGMSGHGHVRGERPRRRRPYQERLAGPVYQREADVQARMGDVLVTLRDDLMM